MIILGSLLFFLSGVGSGFLGALLGIGGGIILIPLLTLLLEVPVREAICASLLSVIVTSCAVARGKMRDRLIPLKLATMLEGLTLLAGLLGAMTAVTVEQNYLKKGFALLVITISLFMILSRFLRKPDSGLGPIEGQRSIADRPIRQRKVWSESYFDRTTQGELHYTISNLPLLLLVTGASGYLSGLLGIGGGVIVVPFMVLVGGVPIKVATATSSYIMALTAWGSSLYYMAQGNLNLSMSAMIMLGVFVGASISVRFLGKISSQWLEWLFVFLLIIVGVRMWMA